MEQGKNVGGEEGKEGAPSEAQMVQMMLGAIESKFQMMSEAILGRMDEMAGKINELEESMNVLMDRSGIDAKEVQEEIKKLEHDKA